MKTFGAGILVATPLVDANGNAIANPTPAPFGTLQDVSLDFSFDVKPLYGAGQFPEVVGRGKGKITGKAKFARFYASIFNACFVGQPSNQTAGTLSTISQDTTGTAIPATPYQITPTVPSSGTWVADVGVFFSTNLDVPLVRVASAPATGQYAVTAGVYTFAAADTAKTVYISFRYTASITGAQKIVVANLNMGYAPSIRLELSETYAGKSTTWRLLNVLPTKFAFDYKNEDWTIPDFEFEAFQDSASANVFETYTSE